MKTLKMMILLTAVLFSFAACKKDKVPQKTPEQVTQEKILGKWNFESGTIVTTNPPNPEKTENLTGRPGLYFEFRTDGIAKNNLEGETEDPYVLKSSTSLQIGDYTYTIKELTANRLVIESVQRHETITVRFTMIFSRK